MHVDNQLLRDLRGELRATYPAIDPRAIDRLVRRAGGRLPPGLLLTASARFPRSRAVAASGDGHPLFSESFYLTANPDVAASGAPAWLHYQVFGRHEGRAPHPLVNPQMLAAGIPDADPSEALDVYLADPSRWWVEPSPYVECQRFLMSGHWDGVMNPLIDLVTNGLSGPWVHSRLMLVDLASPDAAAARLAGVGTVLSTLPGTTVGASVRVWRHDGADLPSGRQDYTVVPGFFLGAAGRRLSEPSDSSTSPDGTVAQLADETISVEAGPALTGHRLVYLADEAGRLELDDLLDEIPPASVLAPFSRAQEVSLRQLRRDRNRAQLTVLEHGRQAHVSSPELQVVHPEEAPPLTALRAEDPADDLAVVIASGSRRRATGDPALRSLLARGAALCIVDAHGVNSWLPVLQARSRVAVEAALVSAIGSFVPWESMRLLPAAGRWSS